MRSYPSFIAGLAHNAPNGKSRGRYAFRRLRASDKLDLVREPENPHDSNAVAILHEGFHVGYVPARHNWVGRALDEGDTVVAQVVRLATEKDGWFARKATHVDIVIHVVKDG